MFSSKEKILLILVKLDLEKAFDHLSWDSILKVLKSMNFPSKFIHWINVCICPTLSLVDVGKDKEIPCLHSSIS